MLSEVVVITGQAFYDALTFIKPSLESASGFKLNLNVQSAASRRDALEKGKRTNLYIDDHKHVLQQGTGMVPLMMQSKSSHNFLAAHMRSSTHLRISRRSKLFNSLVTRI